MKNSNNFPRNLEKNKIHKYQKDIHNQQQKDYLRNNERLYQLFDWNTQKDYLKQS